jgi:hypothetical protein
MRPVAVPNAAPLANNLAAIKGAQEVIAVGSVNVNPVPCTPQLAQVAATKRRSPSSHVKTALSIVGIATSLARTILRVLEDRAGNAFVPDYREPRQAL